MQILGCALKRKEEGSCLFPPPRPANGHAATRAGSGSATVDHNGEDGRATRQKEPRPPVTGEATTPDLTAKYTFTRERIKFYFI